MGHRKGWKSVTDKEKIMKDHGRDQVRLTKGPEYVCASDRQRVQSYLLVKGKGEKAKDWDIADIIAEIRENDAMSCERTMQRSSAFSKIKLPEVEA